MIYELNVFTCRPGGHLALAKHDGTVGRAIRGDRFGTLAGCWLTEHGALNQMMQLWSYESAEDQARSSRALARDGRWIDEFLAPAREFLLRRETKVLEPFLPFEAPPGAAGHVYEYRAYRPRPAMTPCLVPPVRRCNAGPPAVRRPGVRLDRGCRTCRRRIAPVGLCEPRRASGVAGAGGKGSGLADVREVGRSHARGNDLDRHAACQPFALSLAMLRLRPTGHARRP